ncbi:uncharacterized protein LOC125497456 [Beta vulgaris subsp. vulgaris]|uniref:uncharacterized protein LOC125497456 n=1 Tax=Beta vulgaris subsp. vulgaris TaxID=3555 RepID=UPI002036CC06|nr:uncharacterized protein LOC125497456 [Beta vulgaris subsp. vulgaris]
MEGLIWRVGNGTHIIDLWADPWVGDEDRRFIQSNRVDGLNVEGDLIDEARREWRVEVVEQHFNERDQRCILSIPLSSRNLQDELTWAYSKYGVYSVKTAYMLGKGGNSEDFHRAWGILWSLEVSLKVRHYCGAFIYTNLLLVRELVRRHLVDVSCYPCCLSEVETQHHMLFFCSSIASLWGDLGCHSLLPRIAEEGMCETLERWSKLDLTLVQKGCYIMWNVWAM